MGKKGCQSVNKVVQWENKVGQRIKKKVVSGYIKLVSGKIKLVSGYIKFVSGKIKLAKR